MSEMATLAEACLKRFRAGNDTKQVAAHFGLTEAKASRLIWIARCRERGLPAEYSSRGILKRIAA